MSDVSNPSGSAQGQAPKDATNLAMLAHALGIFFSVIGPLLIWLLKKEEHEFVDDQAKEALNWEITMAIGYVVCSILTTVLIGAFLLPVVGLVDVIFNIIGAVKSSQGVRYRYPFALRLVK